jgi:hypothetical protein
MVNTHKQIKIKQNMKKEIEELAMSIRGLLSSVYYLEEELKDILADAEYVSRRVEEEFKLWELVFWWGSPDIGFEPVNSMISTDRDALREYYESQDTKFELVEVEEADRKETTRNKMLAGEEFWEIRDVSDRWVKPLAASTGYLVKYNK